jgi:hypothetical protein
MQHKINTYKNFIWRYENDVDLKPKQHSNNKPILQYSLLGEFIKEWKSASEAAEILFQKQSSSISDCLKGKTKKSYGFIWKFKILN